MALSDQIAAFGTDIDSVIERYIAEFDIPACAMIGIIAIVQARLIERVYEDEDEDDDED